MQKWPKHKLQSSGIGNKQRNYFLNITVITLMGCHLTIYNVGAYNNVNTPLRFYAS